MRARKRFAALTAAILTALSGAALAQEYDAQQAKSWMAQFAQALLQFSPINDPAQTLDPARPGEYLQEYEFGTVQAATSGTPTAATRSRCFICGLQTGARASDTTRLPCRVQFRQNRARAHS